MVPIVIQFSCGQILVESALHSLALNGRHNHIELDESPKYNTIQYNTWQVYVTMQARPEFGEKNTNSYNRLVLKVIHT